MPDPKQNGHAKLTPGDFVPEIWTARQLREMVFPEPKWAVPGLIPQGLTILAGAPKIGKSWLCFGFTLAIANGGMALGQIPVERGRALYLALEDPGRRLQDRLRILTENWRIEVPEGADFAARWPRMGRRGLNRIYDYVEEHPDTRLVIIDTLAKVRNEAQQGRNAYDEDYRTGEQIKAVADDCGIAIVIVHHLRKMDATDVYEKISGSNGLTGSADGVMIVTRQRGKADAVLFASGRDVPEQELAVKFDPKMASWSIIGEASEVRLSSERQFVLKVLRDRDEAMAPREITPLLWQGAKVGNVTTLLGEMAKAGEIKSLGHGLYTAIPKIGLAQDATRYMRLDRLESRDSNQPNQPNRSNQPNRVPSDSEGAMCCLGCGKPLPEGEYFRCYDCIEDMAHVIDPN